MDVQPFINPKHLANGAVLTILHAVQQLLKAKRRKALAVQAESLGTKERMAADTATSAKLIEIKRQLFLSA